MLPGRRTAASSHPLATPPQVYLQWITALRYTSALYYSFQAVMVTEFGGLLLPCTGSAGGGGAGVGAWIGRALPDLSNAQRSALEMLLKRSGGGDRCVFDPASTLEHDDITRSYEQNVGILVGYLLLLLLITYCAMLITTRRERR